MSFKNLCRRVLDVAALGVGIASLAACSDDDARTAAGSGAQGAAGSSGPAPEAALRIDFACEQTLTVE